MKLRINNEVLTSLLLLVANTIYLTQIFHLPVPFEEGEPGPGFYPIVLCGALYLACVRIFVRGLKKGGCVQISLKDSAVLRPLAAIGATGIFILLFKPAGYFVATLIYTFMMSLLFEWGRKYTPVKTILFSVLLAVIITSLGWVFFGLLFDLHLPKGDWFYVG